MNSIHLLALASVAVASPCLASTSPSQHGEVILEAQGDLGLSVQIPFQGEVLHLDLQRDLRSPAAEYSIEGPGGVRSTQLSERHLYTGSLGGQPSALVGAFLVRGELHALVLDEDPGRSWTITPSPELEGAYDVLTLEESAWIAEPSSCGAMSEGALAGAPHGGSGSGQPGGVFDKDASAFGGQTQDLTTVQLVEVALDCDYEFTQFLGGTGAEIGAYMEGCLHLAGLIFEKDMGVRTVTDVVVVRMDPNASGYPYTSPHPGPCYTPCIGNWWINHLDKDFQMVHLFSGKDNPMWAGYANTGSLCGVDPWTMWNVHDVDVGLNLHTRVGTITHELGHAFGIPHQSWLGIGFEGVMGPVGAPLWFSDTDVAVAQAYLSGLGAGCLPGTDQGAPAPTLSSQPLPDVTPLPDPEVTLTGTNLDWVYKVEVNGNNVRMNHWDRISSEKLRVPLFPIHWVGLGDQVVTVHTPGGVASTTVELVPNAPPVQSNNMLDFGVPVLRTVLSSLPSSTALHFWNASGQTFAQGQLQLLSGAQLIHATTLDSYGLSAGYIWAPTSVEIVIGTTIYVQGMFIEPASGARSATSVEAICVCLP